METAGLPELHVAKVRSLLRGVAPHAPTVTPLGAPRADVALATFADCPDRGLTTLITMGFSKVPFSMWRGLPLGMELTLTTAGDQSQLVDLLGSLITAGTDRVVQDRRRIVEHNGVWAPGYAPHLVFTTVVSATPQLMVRKKVGDTYVEWLTAVPVDDSELRRYERDIPAFLSHLTPQSVTSYPRPAVGRL